MLMQHDLIHSDSRKKSAIHYFDASYVSFTSSHRFNGNIKIIGHEELKFTFYSHKRNLVEFSVEESNRFGNYSSSEYRGMAEFYGMPKISLEDMEDPEEVLLKEAEAKAAEKENKGDKKDEKKGKGQKSQDKDKNKEQADMDTSQRLLCKIPVALPKVLYFD